MKQKDYIACCNRIAVRVNLAAFTHENGTINYTKLEKLIRVLSEFIHAGKEIVLVGSGFLEMGMHKLKLKASPVLVREKQAVAAVGQCELMHIYNKLFAEHNCIVGQVLLTKGAIEDDNVRKNIIHTFELLLQKGVIPIVAGNDTVDILANTACFEPDYHLLHIVKELTVADIAVQASDIDLCVKA